MTEAQLKVLVAVADAGRFSLAAERLAMSQPGVSRAVASLEAELGTALFTRGPGAVSLTPVGVRATTHAREILARIEMIRQEARITAGGYSGRLRLGSLPSLTARLLSPLLGAFISLHPAVEVELREAPDNAVMAWIRHRNVDAGLVAHAVDDLDVQFLRSVALHAVLPADHRLAGEPTVPLGALETEPLLAVRSGFEHIVADLFAAAGLTPTVAFEVAEAAAALSMVAQRLGVAVLPDLAVEDPREGVVTRPLDPTVEFDVGLASRPLEEAPPAAAAFIDLASGWPVERLGARL